MILMILPLFIICLLFFVSWTIHISQVNDCCETYGWSNFKTFKRHFEQVEWEVDASFSSSLFGKRFDTDNKWHASIIAFNGIGMKLGFIDWYRACIYVWLYKRKHGLRCKKHNYQWQ